MFDIFIKSHFSAGHHLRDYPGNCERPHGHNWKVEVTVRATELDSLGMGIDFRTVKEAVNKVLNSLDHHNLNEHPDFQAVNPSSENIAVFIFNEVQQEIASDRCNVHAVTVCETDNSGVTYFGP
ncbi:MAG: 6-carboxytetrahydropterin synthase QueD [Deltaproteobacteria bacterium]|jgi:6-pyruvoyltetrahydropterin/6-carboxytetrahydropterin synthase|nr:6-carboxytetrahydropterin synthase QueD [Deltaproteobacteria bacterium]